MQKFVLQNRKVKTKQCTHTRTETSDRHQPQPEVSCITACQSCLRLQPGLSKFRNYKLSVWWLSGYLALSTYRGLQHGNYSIIIHSTIMLHNRLIAHVLVEVHLQNLALFSPLSLTVKNWESTKTGRKAAVAALQTAQYVQCFRKFLSRHREHRPDNRISIPTCFRVFCDLCPVAGPGEHWPVVVFIQDCNHQKVWVLVCSDEYALDSWAKEQHGY